ncbi:hypothetical protein BZG36_00871 [Bifiguratus adelaidae]|uniref:ELMO domain-containing protein n=1 Tax=Bifiguratus adelaidae TaxID=1938954 RepID=A0A261Y5Q6_9FUNG|nr:hypothetical protein BZG36_00871 [Bifiguratus adelaidae]
MESTAAMEAEQMIKRLSQLTDKSNSNHTSDADRTPVATDVQPAHQQEDTEQGAQNSRKYVQDPLLGGKDDKVLKIATFSLQKYLKEREFADEFLSRGGLQSLCEIIRSTSGNTLAYALNSLTSLMEHDHGWATLEIDFITYIVSIVTHKQLVNVCRPATAILIKLICADKTHPNPELQCYGFSVIYAAIKKEPQFLPVLVDRLQSQDYILCLNSLSLLNAMLKHVTDDLRGWFTSELYNFDMRKNILRLMTEHPSDDLTAHLLEFQSLLIRNAHRRRRTQVSFDNPEHVDSLNYIAQVAGLRDDENRWLHLGFTTENPAEEFQQTGLLGLENMCAYVKSNEASFKKMISNQNNVENHRRCPFGRASVEATELLCDYWGITNGYATAIDFQPLVLYYDATHIITVQTIFHFFNEMAATSADFSRVLDLVRSQLKFAMRSADANRCLADFEKSMLGLPYQTIRERRIRELEWADDLLGREAITNLRSRIYKDSYDIVRQQRINCLLQGAWFALPNKQRERSNTLTDRGAQGNLTGPNVSPEGLTSPTTSSNTNENALSIRNRFVRLSTNRKYLHYGDFTDRHPSSKDIEELKERVDISTIKEIQLHNSRVSRLGPPTPTGDQSFRPLSTRLPSNVTISTIKSPTDSTEMPSFTIKLSNTSLSGHSSFTFHCTSHAQFSEWTDGLNLLLDRPITNKVTAEYINTLTEIGVKIKLLSIGGDHMEVPTSSLEIPSIPPGLGEGFFYLE